MYFSGDSLTFLLPILTFMILMYMIRYMLQITESPISCHCRQKMYTCGIHHRSNIESNTLLQCAMNGHSITDVTPISTDNNQL